jgi:hypothetical protein
MKKLILALMVMLLSINVYAVLSIDKLGVNQAVLVWDTVPTSGAYASYKVVYSKGEPLGSTVTANIKDVSFIEMKTNTTGTRAYYTLSTLEVNNMYQAQIVPIRAGNVVWAEASNNVTFTPKSGDFYISPLNDWIMVSDSATAGTAVDITTTPMVEGDYYVSQISTASSAAGVSGIYIDGVLVDVIDNVASGQGTKTYSPPMRIPDGSTFSITVISGASVTRYITYKYFVNTHYGK